MHIRPEKGLRMTVDAPPRPALKAGPRFTGSAVANAASGLAPMASNRRPAAVVFTATVATATTTMAT